MNQGPGSSPEEEIVESILKDGREQAKRVIDGARRSEAAERRKAEAEAEKIRKEILGQAESRARAIRSKEIASAKIEFKRSLLRAREEAVSKVLQIIEREVAKVREQPEEYRRTMVSLAVEAVSAVGGSEVILRIDEQDRNTVDDALIDLIARGVAEKTGSTINIKVETDPAAGDGGCKATSPDGRVVFDNTFSRRLERMRPELRSAIVREVLKTDG